MAKNARKVSLGPAAADPAVPPVRARADVLRVPAYRQGKAPVKPGFKLTSNELPFEPLPQVLEAVQQRTDLNRYANPSHQALRERIAARHAATPDMVHLGAGSVTVLFQLIQAVAGPGDEYVFAWPSFEAYPLLGVVSGASPVPVPLTDTSEHDLDAMAEAITDRTRAVLVCSPNNPTGPTVTQAALDAFLDRVPNDVLVVFDEAYAEFITRDDAATGDRLLNRRNVVVLRTFSKAYGLASLRIGYGIADPAIWDLASRVAIPLAISGPAENAALASLEPEAQAALRERVNEVIARRESLVTQLRDLIHTAEAQGRWPAGSVQIPESQSNFVWIPDTEHSRATVLVDAFAAEGTLVRAYPGVGTRITVGEAESVAEVVRILSTVFGVNGATR